MVPAGLWNAFRHEFALVVRHPERIVAGLVVNGALFAGAWFLLPAAWTTGTLFKVHAAWAFPTLLATWLLADTFATNVFGGESARMLALLDDPAELRRVLHAKDLVLWVLTVPACLLVSLAVGAFAGQDWRLAAGLVVVAVMPFAALGIAPVLGVLLPYHPLPLATRWRDRRRLRWRNVRWATLVVVPYFIVGPLTALAIAPTLLLWLATSGNLTHVPPVWADVLGAALAITTAVTTWIVGNRLTLRLVAHRTAALRTYLTDPTNG